MELSTTRANPLIDPTLHVWSWQIPVYLFLGGLVAGLMVIWGWFALAERGRRADSVLPQLPLLGLGLLSLGMLALFLDLEHKPFFWRLYTTFQPASPMSWGAWILVAVYPGLLGALLLDPPAWLLRRADWIGRLGSALARHPRGPRAVALLNLTLGGLLGLYTGVLLSALGARPLWSSALLAPLFLASGLSSAAAFVHMATRDRRESENLARADNRFLQIELGLIGLFLLGLATSSRVHGSAAGLFLGGPFTALFWVGVVGLGILVPLVIQSLAVNHRIAHSPVAPLLVLAGGLMLRFVIVYAGQWSHWSPG